MKFLLLLTIFITTISASVKPLEHVSLQLMWQDQFQFAGYYMAKEKGFYKNEGLEVDIKKYSNSTNVSQEVLENRATFGVGRSNLIKLASEGKEIVLVSAIFQSSPLTILALESSGIKSIDDFPEKSVMMSEDSIELAAVYAMIFSNKVQIKDMLIKEQSFNIDSLIDGETDLYYGYISNEPYFLEEKKIKYKMFYPKDYGFDFYSDILFTSKSEVYNNPQRVRRFKKASLRGWEYAFEHIDETAKLIYEKYNPQNKTLGALVFEAKQLKKLAYVKNTKLGDLSKTKIKTIFDVYKITGYAKGNIDMDELIFNGQTNLLTLKQNNYLRARKEIKICVSKSCIPYCGEEDGKYIGIGSEILDIVRKDISLDFRIVKDGSDEECDLVPISLITQEKAKYFRFTTPYYHERLVVVTDNSKNYILDMQNILDRKFSVVKGAPYIEYLKSSYPSLKLVEVEDTEKGFLGVKDGKYYGHIDMKIVTAYYMQRYRELSIKISAQLDVNMPVSFGIKKDDFILYDIFETMSQNISPKEMQEILNRWVPISYVTTVNYRYIKRIAVAVFVLLLFLITIFTYKQHFLKRKNRELEELQNELVTLNKSLEDKVRHAVEEVEKKDAFLFQQSRLAQQGEMLSMIAHQWKQPLSIISTIQISIKLALELEKYDLEDKDKREEFIIYLNEKLEKLEKYTKNLSKIIEDFSDFYKPDRESKVMQIDDILLKARDFSQETLTAQNIVLHLDFQSKRLIKVHENEILQTMLNIIHNAKDQLIYKNTISPMIKLKSYDEDDCTIVEISDNAGGIDEKIISKVFDPYFSTKLSQNGTGLVLYMAKTIIENYHNGSVSVANYTDENGEVGAIFRVRIKQEKVNVKS